MTFSGPYEGIQRPYGRIWAGGEKKSKPWLPTGVGQILIYYSYGKFLMTCPVSTNLRVLLLRLRSRGYDKNKLEPL